MRADAFAREFARPPAQNIWAGQCVCVFFLQVCRRLRIIHQGRTKRRRCLAAACKAAGLLCGQGRPFGILPGRRRNSWRAAQSVDSLQKRKVRDAFSWASRGNILHVAPVARESTNPPTATGACGSANHCRRAPSVPAVVCLGFDWRDGLSHHFGWP